MQHSENTSALEVRLEAVEERYRRLRIAFGLTLVLLAGISLSAATTQEVQNNTKTRVLTLLDDNGKTRATLMAIGGAGPRLDFYDDVGRVTLTLACDKDGSSVCLSDGKLPRASLSWSKGVEVKNARYGVKRLGEGSFIHLCDQKGDSRATLEVSDNSPWLRLTDDKGQTEAGLSDSDTLGPLLHLRSLQGVIEAEVFPADSTKPGPSVRMVDANKKEIWSVPR